MVRRTYSSLPACLVLTGDKPIHSTHLALNRGAMAPCSRAVTAFYLGKAGTLKPSLGRHKETLRTRFNKYAVAGRLLGPAQEKGEKMAMFRELQGRGFSLWYRWEPA